MFTKIIWLEKLNLFFFHQIKLLEVFLLSGNGKEQLGLIEFEHYIPCTDDNGNLIEDANFYYEWLNKGQNIAKKGCEYVRNKFGKNYINEYINIIKN